MDTAEHESGGAADFFSVISVASIACWLIRLRKHQIEPEESKLNARNQSIIGRVFTLMEPIVDGYGKLHVDDSFWKVCGEKREKDIKVKVVSVDGMTSNVKPVDW